MRYGVIGENLLERAVLASGMAPKAVIEGYAPANCRAVVLATEHGVFDALAAGPRPADAVAAACALDPRATRKLLDLLVAMRYLKARQGEYRLARHVRRWLVTDRPRSLRDAVLMERLEWRWIEGLDTFIRDGRSIHVHEGLSSVDWALYQRGMRALAGMLAPLLVRAVPVPKGARSMLDIGGSHGYFSVALCRRHPDLRSTVLDLPPAIEQAVPLLQAEGMGDRVVMQAGDALTDDLGESVYDLILMCNVVHHFDDAENRRLAEKSARALRPGGMLVIAEFFRRDRGKVDQWAAFFDLYFALSNQVGLWTFDEMATWQRAGGLLPRKPRRLRFARGFGLQVADKPS
jgi:SAM-dependent methyltransferase